ncbi:MAG: hypothetical protein HC846_03240 [Blastocatellia bacterium]|nr:hypothetical protein [Blastocatellia bacterium]
MEEFLTQLMGKKVDALCGTGTAVRGEIVDVKKGILYLRDEEKVAYVAVDKIAVVWEVKDHEVRTGFVTGKLK